MVDIRSRSDVMVVDNLKVQFTSRRGPFGRRTLRAIDGVSFTLGRGETLGIVGESGCGKSTLVRTLFGINKIAGGKFEILGRDMTSLSSRDRRAIRNRVQLVFQDPFSALDPRMTAHDIVAEPLRIARMYSRTRVIELIEQVGLQREMLERRPHQFSGGQRQRIGIARALALEPDVLVLDEPVSALDVSVQAQVINLLQDLQEKRGLSYLFIAHDLSVVRHLSDRVAVMHLGKIVETGTTEEVFTRPRHPYTRALLAAVPVPDPHQRGRDSSMIIRGELPDASSAPEGCSFRTRCPLASPACSQAEPPLMVATEGGSAAACFFPLDEPVDDLTPHWARSTH